MTGYARVSFPSERGPFVLEIHSVNRKGLDFSFSFPSEFLRFDPDLRKWLSSSLERGQLSVRLFPQVRGNVSSSLYLAELKKGKQKWEEICHSLGWDPSVVTLPFLVSQASCSIEFASEGEESAFRSLLRSQVERALKELILMKEKEGEILARDIEERLHSIEKLLIVAEGQREVPLLAYGKKIKERLQEVCGSALDVQMEERVAREVALLSEKMDVTEEIVRLRAHITQMRELLKSSQRSVGRTLEFLSQEMNREINTLGSKSQESALSSCVIKMKSELDRIREQVQNIE